MSSAAATLPAPFPAQYEPEPEPGTERLVSEQEYWQKYSVARMTGLEMGFRMQLEKKTVIRKPDLGLVCKANPVALRLLDRSFHGIFDLCIAISCCPRGRRIGARSRPRPALGEKLSNGPVWPSSGRVPRKPKWSG